MIENLYFDIDESDRICAVSANWDHIAAQQNGSSVTAAHVLGKSVWGFVAGNDTRSYFEKLFDMARSVQKNVALPYRCDTPMVMRSYNMDIVPLSGGHLRIVHSSMPEKSEAFSVIQMDETRIEKVCSICLSVHYDGAWHDDYFAPRGYIRQDDFTVCPTCLNAPKIVWAGER
jgi:hypothetical protein